MMIIKSRKHQKSRDELDRIIRAEIYRFAHERGINLGFLEDSKTVQECIEAIAVRIADLEETTILDKAMIKFVKRTKKERGNV